MAIRRKLKAKMMLGDAKMLSRKPFWNLLDAFGRFADLWEALGRLLGGSWQALGRLLGGS